MRQPDYIPSRLSLLTPWLANFLAVVDPIGANPFGVDANLGADLEDALSNWPTVDLAATDPATRTSVTIAARNTARANCVDLSRQVAQFIQNAPGTTDENRADLGITVPGAGGAPAVIPNDAPTLSLRSSQPGEIRVEVQNTAEPDSRAIPPGAKVIELRKVVGGAPAPNAAGAVVVGTYTRPLFNVAVPVDDRGQTVTYFARYLAPNATTGAKEGAFSAPLAVIGQ